MDLSPISGVRYGSFTSTGGTQLLNLGFVPSFYEAWNITQAASTANPGVQKRVTWYSGMTSGTAIVMSNTAGAATDQSTLISTAGISSYNGTVQQSFTATAVTGISKAAAALVSSASHGLAIGDTVRLYGSTLMPQVNGLTFTVQSGSFTANQFTINLNTNTANFTASTDGFALKVFPGTAAFQPQRQRISGITQASPGVVTTLENHGYSTGDIVRINIPAAFGMQQLNGVLCEIIVLSSTTFSLYVPNTTQIVGGPTPINTSGYTAFAWPAPSSFLGTPAQVIPVGEDSLLTSDPKRNTAFIGLQLGTGVVGSAADVWQYIAILGS